MDYGKLVELYKKLESTTKKLEKRDLVAEFLKKIKKEDIKYAVYLLQGRVLPQWDERKIGFSSRLMIKAIASSVGVSAENVEDEFNKKGDLGSVTEFFVSKKSQQTLFKQKLTLEKVVKNISRLSELEGAGSVDRKIGLVSELLTSAKAEEARFIVRTVLEVLRIGIAEGIIRDAIAKGFDKDVNDVERSFELLVDYGEVAELARSNKLDIVKLKPGRPLKLMLAVLVKDVEEGFDRVGKPGALEFKYDGMRLQVHKLDGKIQLFTRRMENVSKQFPDVVDAVKKHIKGDNFIIDCEAVGYSPKSKKYLPFQKISQRIKRKYNIEEMAKKFPVELNVFDVICYNGKSLINEGFEKRRKIIEKMIKESKREIVLSKSFITKEEKEAKKFFNDAVKAGHEGLMFKSLKAKYKPGRYVGYMAKLKSVMENLDLVIVKSEWGEGKRAGWLTSYTLACKKNGDLVEVGKASTGLKEKSEGLTFKDMTNLLKPLIVSQKGKEVTVKPEVIVEVGYEEIQESPTYSSGYAMRFPRIIRQREDKHISEISTKKEVETLYRSQKK